MTDDALSEYFALELELQDMKGIRSKKLVNYCKMLELIGRSSNQRDHLKLLLSKVGAYANKHEYFFCWDDLNAPYKSYTKTARWCMMFCIGIATQQQKVPWLRAKSEHEKFQDADTESYTQVCNLQQKWEEEVQILLTKDIINDINQKQNPKIKKNKTKEKNNNNHEQIKKKQYEGSTGVKGWEKKSMANVYSNKSKTIINRNHKDKNEMYFDTTNTHNHKHTHSAIKSNW